MTSLSAHEELILLRKRARRRLVGALALVMVSTTVLWTVVGRIPNRPMKPESVQISASNIAAEPVSKVAASAVAVAKPKSGNASQATALVDSLANEPATPVMPPKAPAKATPEPAVTPLVEPKAEPKRKAVEQTDIAEAKPHPKPEKEKPKAKEVIAEAKPAEPKRKKPDPAAILEGRADAEETPAPHKNAQSDSEHKGSFVVQMAALSDPAKADALKAKLAANGVNARFSKVETSKGEVTRVRMGPFATREEADSALRRLAKVGVSAIVVSK